ncbi:polyketide cyclase [Jatrophihabitans sp. YIM 134969]
MIADRWGVTPAEVERHYPCDDVVPSPVLAAWRGVDVQATPEAIWPWLTQIRLAPYSYDLVDNLGRRSPQTLVDLPPPAVGDPFTATAGRPQGEVLHVDPPHSYTGVILGAVMSYVVDAVDASSSRLVVKIVMGRWRVLAPFVSLGDLVMARRQLLNLRDLAEGR